MKWINTPTGYAIQDDDGSVRPERYERATDAAMVIVAEELNVSTRFAHYERMREDQRREDDLARRAS